MQCRLLDRLLNPRNNVMHIRGWWIPWLWPLRWTRRRSVSMNQRGCWRNLSSRIQPLLPALEGLPCPVDALPPPIWVLGLPAVYVSHVSHMDQTVLWPAHISGSTTPGQGARVYRYQKDTNTKTKTHTTFIMNLPPKYPLLNSIFWINSLFFEISYFSHTSNFSFRFFNSMLTNLDHYKLDITISSLHHMIHKPPIPSSETLANIQPRQIFIFVPHIIPTTFTFICNIYLLINSSH